MSVCTDRHTDAARRLARLLALARQARDLAKTLAREDDETFAALSGDDGLPHELIAIGITLGNSIAVVEGDLAHAVEDAAEGATVTVRLPPLRLPHGAPAVT